MPDSPNPPAPAETTPPSAALGDVLVVAAITLLFFVFASSVELSERVTDWTRRHESWQLDELALTLAVLCAGLAWFGWRRLRERSREMRARLQLEAAMQAAVQQNRELARQLLRLQEDERTRIARELHDELAQQCVAIRVEAAGIEDEARSHDLPRVVEGARAIRDSVDRLHGVVRCMLTRLRPPVLDALGLEASLRALAGGWSQRHGIACSVQVDPGCEGLVDEVRVALFRVAQEALTNVARHAGAARVQLVLEPEPDGRALLLAVDDDGRGLLEGALSSSHGIRGMRERAMLIGARLTLAPGQDGGTEVVLDVPLRQP